MGFSIIELLVTLTVLTLGMGAIATTLVSTRSLGQAKHERSLAADAAVSALEALKGVEFAEAFARFNALAADDPGGAGSAPGSAFAVAGLSPRDDDADGFVGEILFPGDSLVLSEDVEDEELGLPRDLNGDGAIDALDHSGDYTLLPVRARVRWNGASGNQQLEFVTVLTDH